MKTFEEWVESEGMSGNVKWFEKCWNDARTDMIPAENAITMPPESEWPGWATGIQMSFTAHNEHERNSGYDPFGNTKHPDDPTKQWKEIMYQKRTKPQPIKMSIEEARKQLQEILGKPVFIE